jgi:MoaA/NifB/PqqE/SkfB family radical SAM enzyme
MIRYAQSKNIYVSISTNGHFVNEKNVDKILDNAPDKLIFSMDGLDEESYQNYRVGGSFKKADEGLRLLIKKRNELKRKKPFVEFQFIVMKQNEHLLDEVKKYGKMLELIKWFLKLCRFHLTRMLYIFFHQIKSISRYTVSKMGLLKLKTN